MGIWFFFRLLRYLGQKSSQEDRQVDGSDFQKGWRLGYDCHGKCNENRDCLNVSSRPDGTSEGQGQLNMLIN